MKRWLVGAGAMAMMLWFSGSAGALPESYGIAKGWPMGPGQSALHAPTNTALPTISPSSPAVGSAETATNGSWSSVVSAYAYQWAYADTSANIIGATSSSYTPVSGDIGHTLSVTVTASNSTGSASATSAATSAVTNVNFNLPTASFAGTAPILAWYDATTQTRALYLDNNIGACTVAAMEDLSGNGNGLDQPSKIYQPACGTSEEPKFLTAASAPSPWLPIGAGFNYGTGTPGFTPGNMFSGLTQVTLAIAFNLDASYSGSALRTIFDSTNNPFPSTQDRLRLDAVGGAGASARCLRATVRPADSTSFTTVTTGCTQLSQSANHYVVLTADVSTNPWTVNMIVDGSTYATFPQTDAVAATTWATTPSSYLLLGNGSGAANASPTDTPCVCTIRGFAALNGIVAGAQLTALETYLGALP